MCTLHLAWLESVQSGASVFYSVRLLAMQPPHVFIRTEFLHRVWHKQRGCVAFWLQLKIAEGTDRPDFVLSVCLGEAACSFFTGWERDCNLLR